MAVIGINCKGYKAEYYETPKRKQSKATDTLRLIFVTTVSLGSLSTVESLDAAVIDIGRFVLCAPKQDADLTPVHKDEALGLVSDIGAEATPHNAVPRGQVHLIKLSLDDLCNVIKNASLLESEGHAVNGMLLHRLVHVR